MELSDGAMRNCQLVLTRYSTGNVVSSPSCAVAVATPNTNPGLEMAETSTEAPIVELWNEAWDELRKNTTLFKEYETRLTASSSSVGFPGPGKHDRA